MEKLDRYRKIVRELIEHYAGYYRPVPETIETFKIIDPVADHYQLLRDGWWNDYRYYGSVLHYQIRDGKVWILHDGTEQGTADELIERGVAREDIVLAFHSPSLRHLAEV